MFFSDYHLHKNAELRKSLLWEYNADVINYQKMRDIIVQRVIERGRLNDFYAILNMLPLKDIKQSIKKIPYLNPKDLAFVCAVFNLDKKELKCYTTKRSGNQHWNS